MRLKKNLNKINYLIKKNQMNTIFVFAIYGFNF